MKTGHDSLGTKQLYLIMVLLQIKGFVNCTHVNMGSTSIICIISTACVVFCSFKKLCEEAFLKLRESGPLFLNLFTMMMSCGIPELQTRDDISYIRYSCMTVCDIYILHLLYYNFLGMLFVLVSRGRRHWRTFVVNSANLCATRGVYH